MLCGNIYSLRNRNIECRCSGNRFNYSCNDKLGYYDGKEIIDTPDKIVEKR